MAIISIIANLFIIYSILKIRVYMLKEILYLNTQIKEIYGIQLKYEIENNIYKRKLAEYVSSIEALVEDNQHLVDELNSINPHKAPDLDE
jgi:uncharacterized protein (UPF0305 family)